MSEEKVMRVVQTDPDKLKEIVNQSVNEALKKQEENFERKKQEIEIKKVLKPEKLHSHKEICPGCENKVKDLGDGISICEGCGTTVIAKDSKYLTCVDCEKPVPESFLHTGKNCPHCGGQKVRARKKTD